MPTFLSGRKARMWLRFLHTSEASGATGPIPAGLTSLGAVVLVWAGRSLALRRLVRSIRTRSTMGSEVEPSAF